RRLPASGSPQSPHGRDLPPRARRAPKQQPVSSSQPTPAASARPTDVAELYLHLRTLLLYVAAMKFRVPEPARGPLLHDVLLSHMSAAVHIDDPKTWLIAAMCNASR